MGGGAGLAMRTAIVLPSLAPPPGQSTPRGRGRGETVVCRWVAQIYAAAASGKARTAPSAAVHARLQYETGPQSSMSLRPPAWETMLRGGRWGSCHPRALASSRTSELAPECRSQQHVPMSMYVFSVRSPHIQPLGLGLLGSGLARP